MVYTWEVKRLLTVVETSQFAKRAAKVWAPDETEEFITYIAAHPLAGDVIVGAEGIRKVRWQSHGRGKRGGVRVIYFFHTEAMPLFLLDLYAKNEKSNLDAHDKKALRAVVQAILKKETKPQ
jgi:hypothetical protein